MIERNKKPTLEQVRTLFPFDVPTLASEAGIVTETLYYALQQYPILKQDAEKIIVALSQHTGLHLSFEHLDIALWEESLVLWSIRASISEQLHASEEQKDHFHFVYAQNQEHAMALAHEWLKQYAHIQYRYFTPCPEGVTIDEISVPGRRLRATGG